MKKRRYLSIRLKFTLIFILILSGVLGALILVNANFLESYTIHTKLNRIQEIVGAVEDYASSDWSEETLVDLERVTQNSNVSVVVLQNIRFIPQVMYASDNIGSGKTGNMINYLYGKTPQAQAIYEQTDNYIIYKSYDDRLGSYQIDCIGLSGEDVGFVLSTPLQSIRETVLMTNRLLIVLGLIAGMIGALIIFLVSSSLLKPIQELSGLSQDMADLNFDARYTGTRRDEIGILGENMNHMSMRLEDTIENLKAANLQLEKDLEEKERIDEMRRVFLSNVSHELKTPIALIQGYSEGLKDGITEDPESTEYYCDVIIDEAQKMNTIVRRLLNLDEIETGHIQMRREVFNLTELMEGLARSSRMLTDTECQVSLDLDPELLVYADQFMMEQAIQNYLSNAYHHVTPQGTVSITARAQLGNVRVKVHNTGNPIPEEDISHIWEKFYKVDKARTRAYGGSGIGLSIVKAIMHNHKAPYGVMNEGDGVTFWFELPVLTYEEANRLQEEE